jgi:LacI family transcriptional regulator
MGLTVDESLVLPLSYHCRPEESVQQIRRFISERPEMDAIFFATNYVGVYGLEAIKDLGCRIPGDLAVVCFDDHDIFRLYTPGITIVKQPVDLIAQTAMQLLMRQFEQAPGMHFTTGSFQVLQPAELVVRASA